MLWLGLAIGLVVGASFGAVIMGCLVAAKRADKTAERDYGERQPTSPTASTAARRACS
jgi:hypothetical protein